MGIVSRRCQRYRAQCDDLRLLFGTAAQKRALAAGSRRAETAQQAQCEASQSGAAKTAQRPNPPIVRQRRENNG